MVIKEKILLGILVPGLIGSVVTTVAKYMSGTTFLVFLSKPMYIYTVCILVFIIFDWVWSGWVQSLYNQWRIGKFRGLWQDRGLEKQLEKNFCSSEKIRIKVTRGKELLNSKKRQSFNKQLCLLRDGKGKNHDRPVTMQILLVFPCYQEPHVVERKKAHSHLTNDKFLESWYDFLIEIKKYNSTNLTIEVKFYSGNHARWRFYIFEKAKESDTTCVLLSEYDKELGGIDKPMYKVMRGEKNIANFLCGYFDELWNSALTEEALINYIEKGKCQSIFCAGCNAQTGNLCEKCEKNTCSYQEMCKRLVQRYAANLS